MTLTREEVLNKFTSSTIGVNGLLNDDQARTFVNEFVQQAELMGDVDRIFKPERSGEFFYIDMAEPATVAATEGTEYTDETGAVTHTKGRYDVVKRRTQFYLTWEDMAWTIEGSGYKDTILSMWMQRWALDSEILACLGDEDANAEPASRMEKLIDINEGWFEQVSAAGGSQILDVANAGWTNTGNPTYPTSALFAAAYNLVPNKYKKFAKQNYRWLAGTRLVEDYRNWLASRSTNLGDSVLQGKTTLTPQGIPFINKNGCDGLAVIPEDLGVGEDETFMILGAPKNFKWIVHREFKLLGEYIRRRDIFEWTGYMYDDFVVVNKPSFVKVIGITKNTTWDYEEAE